MKTILLFLCAALSAVSPLRAGIVVIGNLARTAVVKPGEVFEGVIFLKNTDAQAADVRVFQTDYHSQADGTNEYGDPGKAERSNADWLTVTPTRLKVNPGETQPVRYKGTVPADPALRGTYWSMIMVEPDATPAIAPDGRAHQVAVGLQTTIRFGIQIVTEIGERFPGSLSVPDKRLVRLGSKTFMEFDVVNDGERLLIPAVSVEIFAQDGASIGRFDAGRARIYPTCSVRSRVDLTDVPPGKYTAMLLLDSGESEVMGAQYDLELRPDAEAMEGPVLARKIDQ